jgi:hypothetical protein
VRAGDSILRATSLLLATLFCLASGVAEAARDVTGVVFEDRNRNGARDSGEEGVGGVLVSNQIDVVQTDPKGRYRLRPPEEGFAVFVVKPSRYAVPLDENNLPRFFYIHQREGSPVRRYRGVDPTGPLRKSVDFPLYRTEYRDTFDVVVFADPQPRSNREIDFIRDDVVAELVGSEAAFGITLGDIMYNDLSLFDRYNEVVSRIGIPFYNVSGNHDMNFDAETDHNALDTFKRLFGLTYYAFEYGRACFVVLDDVEWMGPGDTGTGNYRGLIGEKQLRWLENYLRFVPEDRLIVLAMHIPLVIGDGTEERVNVADRDQLFEILETREHLLAITGHMHFIEHRELDTSVGWNGHSPLVQISCSAVSGAWWMGPPDERSIPTTDQRDGTPNGYHIFRFDGANYSQRFKAAGQSEVYQTRISMPRGTLTHDEAEMVGVVANVFNADTKATVEYRLDGSAFRPMARRVMIDPFFAALMLVHADRYEDWVEPVPSNHLWAASLPGDLAPGVHTIVVRTVFGDGQVYQRSAVFEISDR